MAAEEKQMSAAYLILTKWLKVMFNLLIDVAITLAMTWAMVSTSAPVRAQSTTVAGPAFVATPIVSLHAAIPVVGWKAHPNQVDYIVHSNQINAGNFMRYDIMSVMVASEMAEAMPRYREVQASFAQRAPEALSSIYLPLVMGGAASTSAPTSAAPTSVPRYGIFEQTFHWNSAGYTNPWEQVRITLTLTAPNQASVTVGGFFYMTDTWKTRYSPADLGMWSWQAALNDGRQSISAQGVFTVTPSSRPGFVRKNPTNHNRWVFDDGTPFYAIGIGDCINDPFGYRWGFDGPLQGTPGATEAFTTTDVYLGAYSAAGVNLFRWSVDNCAFGLYRTISPTISGGNSYLAQRGLDGDTLVQKLREYGFRTYMSIFGFCPPYPNDTNDPAKMAAVKRYVKYVVDRYGAYVDFWELMNEYPPNQVCHTTTIDRDWYVQIGGYLKRVDPYAHPLSTSWPTNTVPLLDFTAPHWYMREDEFQSDLVTAHEINRWKAYNNQAVIFGEQGNSEANWDDRSAVRMRLRSWTAFFNEGILIFWNTSSIKVSPPVPGNTAANLYLGPQERGYLQVLQNFVSDLDAHLVITGTNFSISDPARVRGYALRSPRHYVAYLHAYADHVNQTTGITVMVDPLSAGMAQWIEPTTGAVLATQRIGAGLQTLIVPPFTVDIALKIASL